MYRWPTVIPFVYASTVILEATYTLHLFDTSMVPTQKEVLRSDVETKDSKPSQ